MKKIFLSSLLTFHFSFFTSCFAQFTGGSYSGFAFSNIACPAVSNIFTGGSYDGFSSNTISCPATIFSGGSFDGFSLASIACSSIFLGGSYDGFSFNNVSCPIPTNIFTGGSYDGFSFSNIACPIPINIFTGGSYDGFSFTNIACPVPINIFLGGSHDGFSFSNIACPATIFSGGAFDGFASAVIACSSIFLGGSYDGFSFNNLACVIVNIFTGGIYDGFDLKNFSSTPDCSPIPVPVELLFFDAKPNGKYVDVTWATASEFNSDYFTVEKSQDANIFIEVTKVQGAGNSSTIQNYFARDYDPFNGLSYYRLKQTDFNGQYKNYNPVAVQLNSLDIAIYPTISAGTFYITGNEINKEIIIYNLIGEKIYSSQINSGKAEIDLSKQTSGIYFLNIKSEQGIINKKLILNK